MTIAAPPTPNGALDRDAITIDVVSDIVCPWCYIGKRRLEAAIEKTGETVEIRWRPFQLDPTIPPGGLDRRAYLTKKFGTIAAVDTIHQRLTVTGADVGIPFAFDRIERSPNTLDAHRLVRWAATTNAQGAVVEALFNAYFVAGQNIGDPAILAAIASDCAMDKASVQRLLASDTDATAVHEEIATAVRLGVSGVPFFIFAGRYAVPGAQESDVLAAAIAKARQGEPATMET